MKNSLFIICFIIISLIAVSCDPDSAYIYSISNETDSIVTLRVNTDFDNPMKKNVQVYYVYVNNTRLKLDDFDDKTITIPSHGFARFEHIIAVSVGVNDPPREDNMPLWSSHSCIESIYIGNTKLPEKVWRKHRSWHMVKKKYSSIEYLYTITDN